MVLVSFLIIDMTITLNQRLISVNHGYFIHNKVGKFALFFGNSKRNLIKDSGSIKPFFVMSVIAYAIDLFILIGCILWLLLAYEMAINEGFLFLWIISGGIIALILDGVISIVTILISKKRERRLNKRQCHNLFQDSDTKKSKK